MKCEMSGMLRVTLLAAGLDACAASLTWDADTATAGGQDGAGVWDAVATNWFDGVANANWSDATPDSAIIGAGSGAAGVITNVGTRTLGGIVFNPAGSGSYTITGGLLVLSNHPTFAVNADATVYPALAGGGQSLTKSGTGTLTLVSTSNTFSGPFVVSEGVVVLAANGANGGGGLYNSGRHTNVIQAGATVRLTGSFMAGNVSNDVWVLNGGTLDSAPVVEDGSGPQEYLATLTFDVAPGVLLSSNAKGVRTGYTSGNGTFTVTAAASGSSIVCPQFQLVNNGGQTATFDVADGVSNIDLTVSSTIYDFSSLQGMAVVKNGAGTLLLSGLNSFSGVTRVNAGRVVAGASSTTAGAFGAFNAAATKVTIAEGATVDINGRAAGLDFFYGFTIAGAGTSGQGALVNNGASGTSNNRQTPNITLATNATIGGSGDIYMVNAGHAADTLNLGGFTLTKVGTNTFFLDNTSVVSGGTIVVNQGGFSQFNASSATGTAFVLANSNGVLLNLAGKNLSVGSLTGGGAAGGNVNLGAATLTVGGDDTSPAPFTGAIYGTGGLTKTGNGTQTLSGTNSFSGNVLVAGGTLRSTAGFIGGATALGQNNAVTVGPGATLDIGGVNGTGNQLGASWRNTISVNGGTLVFSLTGAAPQDGPYMGVINLDGATVASATGAGPRWGYTQASGLINATNIASSWSAPVWLVQQAGKALTVNAAANLTMSGPIADYPALTGLPLFKTGDGTLTLTATNTYVGDTTISNGVLALGPGGSIDNTLNIITGSNGVFDVSTAGFTLTGGRTLQGHGAVTGGFATAAGARILPGRDASAGTLTFNGPLSLGAGTTNHFDLSGVTNVGGNVNDLIVVNGDFEPGNSVVAINALTTLTNGTYRLVTYTGSKTSSFQPALVYAAATPRQSLLLDEVSMLGAVDLVVSGSVARLTWNSPLSPDWDVGVSTNWFNAAAGTNDLFYVADAVVFDDTPGVATTIVLATNASPSSFEVLASTNLFTLAGSGRITGQTGLTKRGTNTLVLAMDGTNDFAGAVVVDEGELAVAGTSLQPLGGVAVSNSGVLAFQRAAAFTFANVIRGSGVVVQRGPGTLTLSGANAYAGGTVVSAGELRQPYPGVMGSGAITLGDANTGTNDVAWRFAGATQPTNPVIVAGSGTGTATLGTYSTGLSTVHNAPVVLNRAVTMADATGDRTTFAGPISGTPGTITVTGTRVTFANATNTFLGDIVIRPGSIYQSDAPLALPATTSIANDGAYRLNNGGTHVLNALTGTGLTYVIAGGPATLSLGNAGGSGHFSGRIYDNAAAMSLVKNGAGTQILSGTNAYTGTTTIHGGVLQIGHGGTSGSLGAGAVVDHAALVFNRSDAITNNVAISGTGVLVMAGSGTLTLDGTNVTQIGGTVVSNGTLLVNATLASPAVSVTSAGTLAGTGTVDGSVSVAGTLAPGAPDGTLELLQDFTMATGALLAIELGGTGQGVDYDYLSIGGTALLNGALDVAFVNGFTGTVGDVFVFLNAGVAVSGSFAITNLPPLPAGSAWDLQYMGSFIMLSIVSGPGAGGYDLYAGQIPNPADRGYQNDPDGDGYANLLEYATGGDPTNADTVARMSSARTNGMLALKFSRSLAATDATLYVEGSYATTNDATWTGIATNLAGSWGGAANVTEAGGPERMDVTAADTVPAATNRFLRLRVTRP